MCSKFQKYTKLYKQGKQIQKELLHWEHSGAPGGKIVDAVKEFTTLTVNLIFSPKKICLWPMMLVFSVFYVFCP